MSYTLRQSWSRASKFLRCTSCGGSIKKGERYYYRVGRSDFWTGLATTRECAACCDRYSRSVFIPVEPRGYTA